MQLTLSVITLQEQAPFTSMTHSFNESGGSVGRHQRADWVLLDDKKFLSGEHFSINCDGKDFFVIDTSTNGTFIDDSIHPLGKNNSHQLNEGDRIRLGEYVIMVSISSESANPSSNAHDNGFPSSNSASDSHDPFFSSGGHFDSSSQSANNDNKAHDPYASSSKSSFVDPDLQGVFGQSSNVELSSDPFFSSDESFNPNGTPFNKELDENIIEADSPLNIHTPLALNTVEDKANTQEPSTPDISFNNNKETEPDAFDFLDQKDPKEKNESPIVNEFQTDSPTPEILVTKEKPKKQEAKKEPKVVKKKTQQKSDSKKRTEDKNQKSKDVPDTTNTDNSDAFKMFLKGAGITQNNIPSDVPPETFEIIGHAIKEVLQGTIELLRARAETKNHLHLDRTIIGRVENNPLKFMPNAEQVIVHLLTKEKDDKTYTPLNEALEEAYDDIMAHQFAMTVATQSALKGVMKEHFSPQNLADNMAKTNPISSLIPLQRQAKLWSMFESLYDDVEKEATESFQRLLDNEISSAYEKQLLELKSLRKIDNTNNDDFPG